MQLRLLSLENRQKYNIPSFLIDENLSPLLSDYLQSLKYESLSVREVGLKGMPDEEIIKWIQKNNRVLITADLDFGEFFYFKNFGEIGIIILKSKYQNLKNYIEIIDYLHKEKVLKHKNILNSLVVAVKDKYRVRKYI